jgi:hypothetical protein
MLGQYLDRDKAAMESMPCQVDLRHSATAETAENLVLASQYFAEPFL